MNDMTPMAGPGHNNPPGPVIPAPLLAKVKDHTDAAGAWQDCREIASAEMSEKATDFISGARAVWSEVEAERRAQKKPHDDAATAVQALFTPLLSKVKISGERVAMMQTAWLKAERDREEARKREEQAEAKRRADEAARLEREAGARNDISGMVDAQEARKAAARDLKAASAPVRAQAQSATGAGRTVSLRTTYHCVVEARGPALSRYRDHPEVIALIERLATAEVRAQPPGEKIAPTGFRLIKDEKAA